MTFSDSDEAYSIPSTTPLSGTLYVRTATSLRGPFSVGVLKSMQARGDIQRDSLLSPDRVRWVDAASLPEVFPPTLFPKSTPTTEQEMLWHVMIEGERQGPISYESLYELAETGKLRAFDKVTVDGGDKWVLASTVRGLPVPTDFGPSVLADSKSSWLIGGGIASAVLVLIPAIVVLIWNEKRIGRDLYVNDREDVQTHVTELQDSSQESNEKIESNRNETSKSVATIKGTATVESARLNAAAVGAKVAQEKKMHEENLAKKDEEIAASDRAAAASIQGANITANATDEASRRDANATREAGAAVQSSIDKNTRAIEKR